MVLTCLSPERLYFKEGLSENLLKCFKRGIQTLGLSRVEDRTWKVWKLPL